MRGVQHTASRAVWLARTVMEWVSPDGLIHDVQSDPRFQHVGVDFLWEVPEQPLRGIEVKGDRYAKGGNFFFELVSNFERNTPGCFLYTQADVLAYAFVQTREVHWLPLAATRQWFLQHAPGFALRHTQTRMGPHHYTTIGALVPVTRVLAEVGGCERYRVEVDGNVLSVPHVARRKKTSTGARLPK